MGMLWCTRVLALHFTSPLFEMLFTSPVFEMFLALQVLLAQLPHQTQLMTKGGVLTSKNPGKASPQMI
jgi:hypothetical protein